MKTQLRPPLRRCEGSRDRVSQATRLRQVLGGAGAQIRGHRGAPVPTPPIGPKRAAAKRTREHPKVPPGAYGAHCRWYGEGERSVKVASTPHPIWHTGAFPHPLGGVGGGLWFGEAGFGRPDACISVNPWCITTTLCLDKAVLRQSVLQGTRPAH